MQSTTGKLDTSLLDVPIGQPVVNRHRFDYEGFSGAIFGSFSVTGFDQNGTLQAKGGPRIFSRGGGGGGGV